MKVWLYYWSGGDIFLLKNPMQPSGAGSWYISDIDKKIGFLRTPHTTDVGIFLIETFKPERNTPLEIELG